MAQTSHTALVIIIIQISEVILFISSGKQYMIQSTRYISGSASMATDIPEPVPLVAETHTRISAGVTK